MGQALRFKILWVWVFFHICCLQAQAQFLQYEDIPRLTLNTFQEFSGAFNGRYNELSVLEKFPALVNMERVKFIKGLFYPVDSIQPGVLTQFTNYVIRTNAMATPENTVAHVDLVYTDTKKKDLTIHASLMEEETEEGPTWILKEVQSPVFFLGDSTKVGYMGYTNNDVAFSGFEHNAGANPKHIVGEQHSLDHLSVFLYLTANKLLVFKHSENIRYKITIDDYVLTVTRVIDNEKFMNGWLITGLSCQGKILFGKE